MNEKILFQVFDKLRGSPLRGTDTLILSLQLLAWARLSSRGAIDADLHLQPSIARGVDEVHKSLKQLEAQSGLLGQAFTGAAMHAAGAEKVLQAAASMCAQLDASGMLNSFMPTDAAVGFGLGSELWTIDPTLAELMVQLAGPTTNGFYCAWDITAQLAARLVATGQHVFSENQQITPFPALASIFANGHLDVAFSDPIRSPSAISAGHLRRFECALAIPPMGVKADPSLASSDLFGRFTIPKATWAVLTVQHLMAQAMRCAVIAVPHSLLHGIGSDRLLREQLITEGQLDAVISLPPGLLSGTNLQIALLVLSPKGRNDTVRFVNATGEEFKVANGRSKTSLSRVEDIVALALGQTDDICAATVSRSEILANDMQLYVDRYVLDPKQRKLQELIADLHQCPMGELVETLRPLAASLQPVDGAIAVKEVAAADIPSVGYIAPGREMYVEARTAHKASRQFLKPLDIVLVIRGTTGKVGIVPEDVPPPGLGGWIAGASATILRVGPNSPIEPKALAVLLRSPMGQELLATITTGATIPMITLRDLIRLSIPVPTIERARHGSALLDQEQTIQQQIDALQRQQVELAAGDWTLGMLA